MSEFNLPEELVSKAVERMIEDLIKDGITYSLRNAVEKALEEKLLESSIIDALADGIIIHIMSDKEAIITQAGDAIVAGIGKALAESYKAIGSKIVKEVRGYSF